MGVVGTGEEGGFWTVCVLLADCPWAGCQIALCLHFLSYKTRVIIIIIISKPGSSKHFTYRIMHLLPFNYPTRSEFILSKFGR